jgi:predicted nucleic acid-binding protein
LIIDASVAFKWLIAEDDSHLAIDWIGKTDLHAPTIVLAEVGNALWKAVRRREIPGDAETVAMLGRLDQLLVLVDERSVIGRALEIAVQLDHAIYDCLYLALAEERRELLLTADDKFLRKAFAAGYASHLLPLIPAI